MSSYQQLTRLRCFDFALGAVYAPDPDTAMTFALAHGMAGPGSARERDRLCMDALDAMRRAAHRTPS